MAKASNLLLSRGLHDSNDLGVLRTLAGLHPVGMPTTAPAWPPGPRTQIPTPGWTGSSTLIRSFPAGRELRV